MIEDFGSYLKSERELRGVTLEEVATKTKIHIRFLRALEENLFDKLPGEVFIKGYIRSIAMVIGASENEMLSAYADITKKLSDADSENQNIPIEKKPTFDMNFIFVVGLAIIFLIVVVWGTNILIRKVDKVSMESDPVVLNPKQNETGGIPAKNLSVSGPAIEGKAISLKETDILSNTSAVVSKKPSENHSGKPILSVENSSATVENGDTLEEFKKNSNTTPDISNNGNEGGVPTLFAKNDMPLKLNIKGIDNVWFDIMVDDSHVEDFILPKGAEKIFYAKDYYLLNVGDRNAVDLKLNNTTLDLPKSVEGNIVRNFRINSRLID